MQAHPPWHASRRLLSGILLWQSTALAVACVVACVVAGVAGVAVWCGAVP